MQNNPTANASLTAGIYSHINRNIVPWMMCIIGALFYSYAYFLRVSPSVMVGDLEQHFRITAGDFGALTAFYYYAYTPMQLPVGLIVDRFGAKTILCTATLICIAGVFLFSHSNEYGYAALGRFLIGFGSAFGYVTVLKLATLWLPPKRFAFAAGSTTAIGMMSAIFANLVLTRMVQNQGYEIALQATMIAGVALFILTFFILRSKPKTPRAENTAGHSNPLNFKQLLGHMYLIFKNPQMWLIGIVGCLLYLPASVFLDTWDISYFTTVYNISKTQAGDIASIILLGWIIGGPVMGALSDMMKRRRTLLTITGFVTGSILSLIIFGPVLPIKVLFVLFFIFGLFCGSHPLCFALARENNSNKVSGTAIAVTNTLIMVGGVVFQPIVGVVLDLFWDGRMQGGQPLYTSYDYTIALSVIPIGLFIAGILMFFVKETHCKVPE